MAATSFAIIGGGWRAAFYLRVARELPARFRVCGVLTRDAAKGRKLEHQWDVRTYRDLDALLAAKPAFVVTSVSWEANPGLVAELIQRGVPVLSETPPAPDLHGLKRLWTLCHQHRAKVQVAEQYLFQPLHAARLAVAASGRLGRVSQAQVSAAHGYHGVSLLRQFLGVAFEEVTVTARQFRCPVIAGPGRDGPPAEELIEHEEQTIAWFDYGDRLGVYDFAGSQYFSWVRSPRLLVRGERGEIDQEEVRWLVDHATPVLVRLERRDTGHAGNLEGYHHAGYLLGSEWVYRNPFGAARLADDEIAVATCLARMAAYVCDEGPEFYSLAHAAQDHYLSLMMERAVSTGQPVVAERQPWGGIGRDAGGRRLPRVRRQP